SQVPSPSVSRPSLAGAPPEWSAPVFTQSSQVSRSTSRHRFGFSGATSEPSAPVTAQSSQVSVSVSLHRFGFSGFESDPSATPSLSSSGSPALHLPSPSVSRPSLATLPPELSAPVTAQSSQVSRSVS